jgi:hypothetical protein
VGALLAAPECGVSLAEARPAATRRHIRYDVQRDVNWVMA